MKRHASLIPLSSHHQNALVLAKHLKAVSPTSTAEDRIRLAEEVVRFWDENGRQHFREEEDVVLPIWANHEEVWGPEVERMLREHLEIRAAVDSFTVALGKGMAPDRDRLVRLGETLDGHVRLEEHVIFERVQRAVPEEDLARMKRLLGGEA